MIAPNVQILLPISQIHRPLVLLRAADGFINVLADACPRPSLLERLAAAQLCPGGVTALTDELLPSHIHLMHTHAHNDCHWIWSRCLLYVFLYWNMKICCLEGEVRIPAGSPFSSNQDKTLTLMVRQVRVVWGGNCVALARVMYCLLWMAV